MSARTGEGLDELRAALGRVADDVEHARTDAPTRLYVDRSFSVPGFGTVVTGTLWSGRIGGGDQLRLEPSGRDVRVRSVQVHDRDVERAEPGQRVAVSLPGVERDGGRDGARRSSRRARIRSRTGSTSSSTSSCRSRTAHESRCTRNGARLRPGSYALGDRFAQLRLASPVVAARGDRVILRGETTLGGGTRARPVAS